MAYIERPKKKTRTGIYDAKDKDRRKIYNSARWRLLRSLKFANNPLCELCKEKGIIRTAEDIHHRVSFMSTEHQGERYALAYDYNNLMSLCKQCHQALHNKCTT